MAWGTSAGGARRAARDAGGVGGRPARAHDQPPGVGLQPDRAGRRAGRRDAHRVRQWRRRVHPVGPPADGRRRPAIRSCSTTVTPPSTATEWRTTAASTPRRCGCWRHPTGRPGCSSPGRTTATRPSTPGTWTPATSPARSPTGIYGAECRRRGRPDDGAPGPGAGVGVSRADGRCSAPTTTGSLTDEVEVRALGAPAPAAGSRDLRHRAPSPRSASTTTGSPPSAGTSTPSTSPATPRCGASTRRPTRCSPLGTAQQTLYDAGVPTDWTQYGPQIAVVPSGGAVTGVNETDSSNADAALRGIAAPTLADPLVVGPRVAAGRADPDQRGDHGPHARSDGHVASFFYKYNTPLVAHVRARRARPGDRRARRRRGPDAARLGLLRHGRARRPPTTGSSASGCRTPRSRSC